MYSPVLMNWPMGNFSIEEVKIVCRCGKKAAYNARISNGRVVKEGEQVQLGENESYTALCRKHWKTGELGLQEVCDDVAEVNGYEIYNGIKESVMGISS